MIHIIIVEDEPAIARGLSLLITQNYPDFQVQAICRNGKEGLKKILEQKPDLVFADINMPVMNGLDMIEQMQSAGYHTRCIILTGYAEFEYARTAIRLGISDYLLKPVAPDTLDEIMNSCREQYRSGLRILQEEYLKRHLNSREELSETCNPLLNYSCTLMVIFSGPMCSNIYNETIVGIETRPADTHLLENLQERHQISLFALPGHHYNETIYALVCPKQQEVNLEQVARSLYESFQQPGTFLNLVVSETALDGEKLYDLTRNTYLFSLFRNCFGCSSIRFFQPISQEDPIHVSQTVKQICAGIPGQPTRETLHDFLHSMLAFWEEQQVTQFQLVADLRYFISTVIHDYTEENIIYPDAAELVSSCQNYDELEKEIQYELDRIYGFGDETLQKDQQSLARQVRNWLDKHFTAQITYKIFQDIFGHNEKYLSSLFKAEFGTSPSKYIGELRLNMAKKLMQSNPDILLKDVAEMVGFTDAFYFSRVFKSHEGVSPSQYMRQLKENLK